MKKIFIILLCMITLNVNATEMCARDDTVVIPLDATINGTGDSSNTVEWLWWISFGYGNIYGSAACLSKKEVMEISGWNGTTSLASGWSLGSASDELLGLSGYYMNADINDKIPDAEKPDYERKYCFLKINHPLSSPWVLSWIHTTGQGSSVSCDPACINNATSMRNTSGVAFRRTIFNSVGTVPPWPMD